MNVKKIICPGVGSAQFILRKKIKRRPFRGGKNMEHFYSHSCGEDALQWATILHPLCGFKNIKIMLAKLERGTPDSLDLIKAMVMDQVRLCTSKPWRRRG